MDMIKLSPAQTSQMSAQASRDQTRLRHKTTQTRPAEPSSPADFTHAADERLTDHVTGQWQPSRDCPALGTAEGRAIE
jgi:hypothetical protein